MLRPPPISTLFPYTTLFRSSSSARFTSRTSSPVSMAVARLSCVAAFESADQYITGMDPYIAKFRAISDLPVRSEEHTSELQSRENLVCRLLLEKKKNDDISH